MASENGLYNRVVALLAREWAVDPSQISPEDRFDQRGDSLTMTNILTAFEDEFAVPFPESLPPAETVADFVARVEQIVQNDSRIT